MVLALVKPPLFLDKKDINLFGIMLFLAVGVLLSYVKNVSNLCR